MIFRSFLALLVTASSAYASDWIPDFLQSDEEVFCQICEVKLTDLLARPDAYKRRQCSLLPAEPVSLEEYTARELGSGSESFQEQMREMFDFYQPQKHAALIEFETENALGSRLISYSSCDTVGPVEKGAVEIAKDDGVWIDGKSDSDWFAERLNITSER